VNTDFAAFLRARLDEKEARARGGYYSHTHWERFTTSAHLGAWQAWRQHFPRDLWDVDANDVISEAARDAIRERITAHEADRTAVALAEVEATREVVRLAERAYDYHETFMNGFAAAMEHALRLYALPHADHPDYREEWRP
jgi:hypothetical protein